MGYNARNDEIRDSVERMRRNHEAYADALAKATGDCSSGVFSRVKPTSKRSKLVLQSRVIKSALITDRQA
jgi:hypothetical protein